MIVLKRKNIIIVAVLIITILTFIFSIGALSNNKVGKADITGAKIVLDAGHGGIDGGVSGINTGVKESDLNLLVVKKLENYLTEAGFNVVLTRNSNAGLYGLATKNLKRKDMEKRKEIICQHAPLLVVSIHMNKYSLSSRRGAQVFFKENDKNAELLANSIQDSFNKMEECVKKSSALKGDYYILNCSEYPSVIAECGFLSNSEDEKLLIQDDYQNKIAYNIFKGIIDYVSRTTTNLFEYDKYQ